MKNVEVQTNSNDDFEVSDVNIFSHRNWPGPTDSSHVGIFLSWACPVQRWAKWSRVTTWSRLFCNLYNVKKSWPSRDSWPLLPTSAPDYQSFIGLTCGLGLSRIKKSEKIMDVTVQHNDIATGIRLTSRKLDNVVLNLLNWNSAESTCKKSYPISSKSHLLRNSFCNQYQVN